MKTLLLLTFIQVSTFCQVVIKGRITDFPIEEILLHEFDYARVKLIPIAKAVPAKDGSYILKFNFDHTREAMLVNHRVFLSPNDTIELNFDEQRIISTKGKFHGNYSFYDSLSKTTWYPPDGFTNYSCHYDTYKADCKALYEKNLRLLTYFQTNTQVSEPFMSYVTRDLKYIYFNTLLSVLVRKECSEPIPSDFFEEIENDLLGEKDFISSTYYNFFYNYKKHKAGVNYFDFSTQGMQCLLEEINRMPKGSDQEFMNFFTFRNLTERISANSEKTVDSLYTYGQSHFENQGYKDDLKKLYTDYHDTKTLFRGEVLSQILQSYSGGTPTLNSILQPNKFKYIDFWASWCGPCKADVPYIQPLEEEFKNIQFISLSIDGDQTKWEKAVEALSINKGNTFLIPEALDTPLAQRLNLTDIPRYIILDKDNKLINAKAPRPSDSEIKEIFRKLK